jgi:hypothetical protein
MYIPYEKHAWNPSRLIDSGNMALWLDASDSNSIVESGNLVSELKDKSGINSVTQTTETDRPITNSIKQNGLNVLDFDNTDYFNIPSGVFSITQGDNYIFIVAKSDVTGVGERLINFTTSGNTRCGLLLETDNTVSYLNRTGFDNFVNVVLTRTQFNIIQGRRVGTTQGIRINGGTETTNASGEDVITDGGAIGATITGTGTLDGKIAEVIILSSDISEEGRQKIEGYLAHKWGIVSDLPANHPYKTNIPIN